VSPPRVPERDSTRSVTQGRAVRRAILLLLCGFCLAPTPGDVGGCGQRVEDLDPVAFHAARRKLDCHACLTCGLTTQTCQQSCSLGGATEQAAEFAESCFPLVHDGEVCLRALQAADCETYATYLADVAPEEPSECHFCPPELEP
jgi:hypothetical protein